MSVICHIGTNSAPTSSAAAASGSARRISVSRASDERMALFLRFDDEPRAHLQV
ncbi:putative signal peptide protein [Halorubrum sp. AJ67]|nr:putative signal peptide protein [Halorubrum sp. AJ67]